MFPASAAVQVPVTSKYSQMLYINLGLCIFFVHVDRI